MAAGKWMFSGSSRAVMRSQACQDAAESPRHLSTDRQMQELISLVGGAFLGYLLARLQRKEEHQERRALLLEVLRNELSYLDPHVGPFRVGVAFHRNELVLLAPARLLDVLDYGDDGPLIRGLLEFQVAVDRHNGLIRSVNLARCIGGAGTGERQLMQQELVQQHAAILAAAERVRRFVSESERPAVGAGIASRLKLRTRAADPRALRRGSADRIPAQARGSA